MKLKVELNVALCCDLSRRKAQKIIMKRFPGVNPIAMDMELKKMTVVGDDIDAVHVVDALRRHWRTELLSVHPVRKPENNYYDRKGDEGGGGSSDRGGGSGRGDGGDSDGGNNKDHQDPFKKLGGQKVSPLYNLMDYNNWQRNAKRVKMLMLCFFLEAQRFVLLLRGSAQVFKFPHGEPSERFPGITADETR